MKHYIRLEGDKTKQLFVEIKPLENIITLTAQYKHKINFIDIVSNNVSVDIDYETLLNVIYNTFIEMDNKLPKIIEQREFLSTLKFIELNKDYVEE